jgi:hypothetical protein
MFRDRLRLWGMNDKNRRKVLNNCRRARCSAGNDGLVSSQWEARYQTADASLRMRLFIDARIHVTLSTSKEFQAWQQALKGVLDWQQRLAESAAEVDEDLLRDDASTFHDLLVDIRNTTSLIRSNPRICKSATRRLEKISAAIGNQQSSEIYRLSRHSLSSIAGGFAATVPCGRSEIQRMVQHNLRVSSEGGRGDTTRMPSNALVYESTASRRICL